MSVTTTLAKLVEETEFQDFSSEAVTHAKRSIRDFLGVAIYGSHHEVGETIMKYIDSRSSEGDSLILGYGMYDAPYAALANGTFGHAVDYDDTFESIVLHPSGSSFPAALAVAEEESSTGKDILTGYIVGLEVAFRVGRSMEPTHWEDGWHSTGTIGIFGSTAAACSVLGLSIEETERAFGIAGSSSSGLGRNSGTMTKPFHPGHAAHMGVQAALLARNGFTADRNILEGQGGFGPVYTNDNKFYPERITDPELDDWAVLDNGFKPYPSGVVTDAPMEALRSVMRENDLYNEDIETVSVTVDERFEPILDSNPNDALEAKFSYQFCVAAILRERHAGIHQFTDEFVNEPATKEAMKKIEMHLEPNLFSEGKLAEASYGAVVEVTTTTGETLSKTIENAPGSPSNPLPDDRLKSKFIECTTTVYDEEKANQVWDLIGRFEQEDVLNDLERIIC